MIGAPDFEGTLVRTISTGLTIGKRFKREKRHRLHLQLPKKGRL